VRTLANTVALVRWVDAPLGTSGAIIGMATIIGMVAIIGMADGSDGADRSTGRTSMATSSPLPSGLGAITTHSGPMGICSSGMPCSGPVPITRMTQGILISMEAMRMAAPHGRARLELAVSTGKSQVP